MVNGGRIGDATEPFVELYQSSSRRSPSLEVQGGKFHVTVRIGVRTRYYRRAASPPPVGATIDTRCNLQQHGGILVPWRNSITTRLLENGRDRLLAKTPKRSEWSRVLPVHLKLPSSESEHRPAPPHAAATAVRPRRASRIETQATGSTATSDSETVQPGASDCATIDASTTCQNLLPLRSTGCINFEIDDGRTSTSTLLVALEY